MPSKSPKKPRGRPQASVRALAERTQGMPRFSIEMPVELLVQVDEEAAKDDRSRVAEIRVLVGEAIAARRARTS